MHEAIDWLTVTDIVGIQSAWPVTCQHLGFPWLSGYWGISTTLPKTTAEAKSAVGKTLVNVSPLLSQHVNLQHGTSTAPKQSSEDKP